VRTASTLTTLGFAFLLACGTVPDRTAVPAGKGETAKIPGIPRARYWGDLPPEQADEWKRMFAAGLLKG
jgi:hypothetical protein